MIFKEQLKSVRTFLGISQQEMAKKLDVSFSTINRLERGHHSPGYKVKEAFERLCKNEGIVIPPNYKGRKSEDIPITELKTEFGEYNQLREPARKEKTDNWKMAIGLQLVDGLETSQYLQETAKENIEGYISASEVKQRIKEYYKTKAINSSEKDRAEEADKVSAHIAEILSEKTITFNPSELINIHQTLFGGIYDFAGMIRTYNIEKGEWVLNGDSVYYTSANSIMATLDYEFFREKHFKYKGLSKDEILEHLAMFISSLWQVHPFGEGNTRTIAVFLIKYLRSFGFRINNELFAENSWYFRNSLVRANYNNYSNNVYATTGYLKMFLENLLFEGNNSLKNRELKIQPFLKREENKVQIKCNESTLTERQIIEIIKLDPKITQKEIALICGKSERTVKTLISSLQGKGILERAGSRKTGSWRVNIVD